MLQSVQCSDYATMTMNFCRM